DIGRLRRAILEDLDAIMQDLVAGEVLAREELAGGLLGRPSQALAIIAVDRAAVDGAGKPLGDDPGQRGDRTVFGRVAVERGQDRLAEDRRLAGDDAEPAEGHRNVARLRHLLVEHGLVSVAREDLSLNTVALVRDDAEPDVEDDAEEPVTAGR